MKVGIIGAGTAGLSCAFQLKKYGITPTIFEKNPEIGGALCKACMSIPNLSLQPSNPFVYLKEKYELELVPLSKINKMLVCSPKKILEPRGQLGYIMPRGPEAHSIENQIYSYLNIPVIYDTLIDLENIKNSYDKIVIASGNNIMAKELNVWIDGIKCEARIASVIGNFNINNVIIWFNTLYAKNAYAYFIPTNKNSAVMGLIVNNITSDEMDHYWKRFLAIENIKLHITETRDSTLETGFVKTNCLDNKYYFIGNTGGFTSSFLGIGVINSIESGILAGESIVKESDFNQMVSPIKVHIDKMYQLRKAFNKLDNKDFDNMIKLIGTPGIKQVIYNNPGFKMSMVAPMAKIYSKIKGS